MYRSVFQDNLFKGKVVLVTGAGSGIGRCIASELYSLGCTVALAGRNADKLQQVADELSHKDGSDRLLILQMNIRDASSVYSAMSTLISRLGRLDGVVNNAGGQFFSPAGSITERGWKAVVETNLTGTWLVCRAAYDLWMRDNADKADCGIVNITMAMQNGYPGMAHSAAARAGVVNLTKTLAIEWQVRINCLSPGTLLGNGLLNYPEAVRETALDKVPETVPVGRMGTESEVSAVAVFLLSPAASYITGTCIQVDGGCTLSQNALLRQNHSDKCSSTKPFFGYNTADKVFGKSVDKLPPSLVQHYSKLSKDSKL